MSSRIVRAIAGVVVVLAFGACNRAGLRIPGASFEFPQTPVEFLAPSPLPLSIRVDPPADLRSEHLGEKVADGRWKACRTDPFWSTSAATLVGERVQTALSSSKIFAQVHGDSGAPADLVLTTKIHAFCSQAVGFIYARVAGIAAIRLRVSRGDTTLFDRKFERVVTDADPEYTGPSVGTYEQAMLRTMADSLRELLREAVPSLASSAQTWQAPPSSG